MRRKIWAKRKRSQLRKKNEKLLGFNVFYFSLFYSKSPLNWGLWVFFFFKFGAFFFFFIYFYSRFFLFVGGFKQLPNLLKG